jgi:inner membrane protein
VDNVTHSVAGLLLGEVAVQLRQRRSRPAPSPAFRLAAAVAGAVGANLPDADLLYTTGRGPLSYLLHHRGYTHTVPVALLGAVLLWGTALAVWRWRSRVATPTPADRRWLLGLLVAALLSHLALDFTNSYGVHPFWPLDNRWYYGDAIFIVEPWLWVAAVPALIFASPRRWARAVLALLLAAGMALAWGVALVPWGAALALTLGAALTLALAWRLPPPARAAAALAGWAAVTLAFVAGSRAVRREAIAAAAVAEPGLPGGPARLVDVVVTTAPANPLCAAVIVVEARDDRYRVATARVAALPTLLPAQRCGPPRGASPALAPSPRQSTPAVLWEGEWDAPLAELVALARDQCEVAAMLRFVRVPVWAPAGPGALDVGDLRYAGGGNFAELRVAARPARCPGAVPPWIPPRADLLRTTH